MRYFLHGCFIGRSFQCEPVLKITLSSRQFCYSIFQLHIFIFHRLDSIFVQNPFANLIEKQFYRIRDKVFVLSQCWCEHIRHCYVPTFHVGVYVDGITVDNPFIRGFRVENRRGCEAIQMDLVIKRE